MTEPPAMCEACRQTIQPSDRVKPVPVRHRDGIYVGVIHYHCGWRKILADDEIDV